MKFNPGDGTGVVDDVYFITGADSVSYPIADLTRNANRHLYDAIIDVLKVEGRVQLPDINGSSLPIVTATMVADTHEIKLDGPSGAIIGWLKLDAVEVKDSAGNWNRLEEIDVKDLQRTISDFQKTSGVPRWYDIIGNYIYLYPAPAAAQTTLVNGIRFFIQPEITPLVSTDTTPEPGIPEPFHRIVSLGAAYDWICVNDTEQKAQKILSMYEQKRQELREFWAVRNRDLATAFQPAHNQADYL